MPLFFDRRGNAGTGKGTLVNPREVTKAARTVAKHLPVAQEVDRRANPPIKYESASEILAKMGQPQPEPEVKFVYGKKARFENRVNKFPGSKTEARFKAAQETLGKSNADLGLTEHFKFD